MKLFVPGRICLFGEHSDWAGGYRRTNAEIEKGYTLITGTNQGLYAEVKPHPSKLIFHASLGDGEKETFEMPMDAAELLAEAERGSVFSYVAGVAHQVMTHYRVRGLEIDNYKTDLPIKKGLSSSAAVTVLTARAFNRLYDLKMTVRGEMEYAYLGEITTPSRCGRMDQGCAYGNRPILMTFDGERLDVEEVHVPNDLFLVVVDLQAGKDTREILKKLNVCYPFPDDELQKGVQDYLGPVNAKIVHEAMDALSAGDASRIGELMRTAQGSFDRQVAPACPSQLTAPELHKVLNHEPLQKHILGGKGVGSQGDGTAQFIVASAKAQDEAIEIIEEDLGMKCLKLVISPGKRVRKALIPAAGFGTRMFPASKAVKKEMFPVVDADGRIKPVIMAIVEEAVSAGIEEVCVVVQAEDRELFENFFAAPPPIENFNKLSRENQEYCEYLMDLGRRITFVPQEVQEGFGHAVYCAKDWISSEPFLLMLGDHLYRSNIDDSCARQLIDAYEHMEHSVVGLKVTPGDVVHHFGCATGVWEEEGDTLSITEFHEKPTLEYANKHLRVDGLEEGTFLSVFGQYVLSPTIFDYLEEHIERNFREGGEFQLTSCLERLRREEGVGGYIVKGRRFDIGLPEAYRQTIIDFRDPNQV